MTIETPTPILTSDPIALDSSRTDREGRPVFFFGFDQSAEGQGADELQLIDTLIEAGMRLSVLSTKPRETATLDFDSLEVAADGPVSPELAAAWRQGELVLCLAGRVNKQKEMN